MDLQKNIKVFKNSADIPNKELTNLKLTPAIVDEFNSIFKEAAAATAYLDDNQWAVKEKKKQTKHTVNEISLDKVDQASLAQLNQGVANNANNTVAKNLNIVPLQVFMDNTIRALNRISQQELRVNDLIEQFVDGKITEDEVILETTKLNLSMSMITTIVQSAVQTFKEIQQIPV